MNFLFNYMAKLSNKCHISKIFIKEWGTLRLLYCLYTGFVLPEKQYIQCKKVRFLLPW